MRRRSDRLDLAARVKPSVLRRALAAIAFTLFPACAERGPAPAACPGCNVVLVTFDALRADRLGSYGYDKPTSPALDALAARSTVFTNCISQSATTVTAVPALMTGKFPVTDRLLNGLALRPTEATLATVLQESGYRTLAVIAHQFARCEYSGCAGFDVTEDAFPSPEPAQQTAERVVRLLDAEVKSPFLLWVHVRQPHFPYDVAADDFRAMLGRVKDGPMYFAPEVAGLSFFDVLKRLTRHYRAEGEPVESMRVVGGYKLDVTPSVLRQLRALYDANVLAGDRALGVIVEALERRQLLSKTLVVVAADHGEALGEHGWFGHNRLWQGMLHTPLVFYVPGRPPERIDAPAMNVDILPSVTHALGVPLAHPIRGRDLFAPAPAGVAQYAEYEREHVVIVDRFKLRIRKDEVDGLWDLRRDPGEQTDLAAARPEIVTRLRAVGVALRARTLAPASAAPSSEIFERLRALGYVEGDPSDTR